VLRRSISAAYSSAKLPIAVLRRSINAAHCFAALAVPQLRAVERCEKQTRLFIDGVKFALRDLRGGSKYYHSMSRPHTTAEFLLRNVAHLGAADRSKTQPVSRLAQHDAQLLGLPRKTSTDL